ncbi:charged multivesicular body protein 4c-like, partial [Plectropomus leopardus]|uniref:charged multivesicular body protein 4c-like n=1 Tax=Plectropomus leopardus TaxID=160734 RepID=UPI001C4AE166
QQRTISPRGSILNLINLLSILFFLIFIFRDINKIDDLMDDITEQQDVAREISEAISGPFGETYDEDELMAELEELEQQDMEESMGELPNVPSSKLPSAPSRQRASKSRPRLDNLT